MSNETLSNIKVNLEKGLTFVRSQVKGFSQREKMMLAGGILILLGTCLYMVYEPVRDAFQDQTHRFEDLTRQMDNVSLALKRYLKLKNRREAIEALYKEVEISEGVRTLLANLVETKAGIALGQYEIKQNDEHEFGKGYMQSSFKISFVITDYARLIGFLSEVVSGPKPLILQGLEIRRRSTNDGSLEISLDVSTIRRIK